MVMAGIRSSGAVHGAQDLSLKEYQPSRSLGLH
jgi:hypothetical protein